MSVNRDGHVRLLPLHVANKIAAGEVVERPASVVKELVENALDAGADNIRVTITQGGRKLVAIQDNGCGMLKDDALLCLERQATSKIRDVQDIEQIDTLGFRGEAIPSIASVSRFTLTTRRHDADEGTMLQVNAGTLAEVRTAGCPPGTLVEVRDLFCNVPARRKFLRSYTTEENHIREIFIVHALAHPSVGFTLTIDGHERYHLAPTANRIDRVREIFGEDFAAELLPVVPDENNAIAVSGFIERPNLKTPTRRDQYIFVNGRPATAASIAYALREACPIRAGEARPATILFITLPPSQVDVNVHPTKREVRFRDNQAVKAALADALARALKTPFATTQEPNDPLPPPTATVTPPTTTVTPSVTPYTPPSVTPDAPPPVTPYVPPPAQSLAAPLLQPSPVPVQVEFSVESDSTQSKPWRWFKFLAQSDSGYLIIETDAGLVTINPTAARERIAYEKLLETLKNPAACPSQRLLIPETVQLSPVDFGRLTEALDCIRTMGFDIEPFGHDVFKIEAVPQLIGSAAPHDILATVAHDLAIGQTRKAGERWREELIAKSIARTFAGASIKLDDATATHLVEELCACKLPYVCPRGKRVMLFTSTRELDRKFDR